MRDTTFIYVLNDPRNGRLRYVGKSDNPRKRWFAHLQRSGSNNHRGAWIRSLFEQGLEPELQVLLEIPQKGWQRIEQQFIRAYRKLGVDLVNGTDGGSGAVGVLQSVDSRAKRRETCLKSVTPEFREKMRRIVFGSKRSLESKAKMRTAQSNRSLEWRAKIGQAHRGKTVSLEARLKNKIAHTGKVASIETRAKMSASQASRKRSPLSLKHRANISLARRAWFLRKNQKAAL